VIAIIGSVGSSFEGMAGAPPIPRRLTDPTRLAELIAETVPGGDPAALPVEAPEWAEPRECVVNVEKMATENGGQVVHGWNLLETLPDVLMEAEFHSVWRDPAGILHDVTPVEFGLLEPWRTFVADPLLEYEGRQIDNVRIALRDDQLVHSHIRIQERKFAALNEGELADSHGPIAATPELLDLFGREQRLGVKILARYY
jgi:hypothetical protein